MRLVIRRQLLSSLVIPYLLIGMMTIGAHLLVYLKMSNGAKEDYLLKSKIELEKLVKEIDFEIKDMINLGFDLSTNHQVNQLVSVDLPVTVQDRYNMALAIKEMNAIKSYNSFIENVYIYFKQANFVVSNNAYYEPEVAYENFHDGGLKGYEVWRALMERKYYQGKIIEIGGKLAYIVTPSIEGNYNVVCQIDSERLTYLIEDYEASYGGYISLIDKTQRMLIPSRMPKELVGTKEYIEIKVPSNEVDLVYTAFIHTSSISAVAENIKWLIVFSLLIFLSSLAIGLGLMRKNYNHIMRLIQKFKLMDNARAKDKSKIQQELICSEVGYMENVLSDLQSDMTQQKEIMLENSLRKALGGFVDEEMSYGLEGFIEEIHAEEFMVGIVEFIDQKEISGKEKQFRAFAIANVLTEILENKGSSHVLLMDQTYVIVVYIEKNLKGDKAQHIIEILKQTKKFLNEHMQMKGTWSLSGVYVGVEALHEAYKEARRGLEYKLVLGNEEIILAREFHEQDLNYIYSIDLELRIINSIKQREITEAIKVIDYLLDINLNQQNLSIESIKCFLIDICGTLMKLAQQLKISLELNPSRLMNQAYTYEAIRQEVHQAVYELSETMEEMPRGNEWTKGKDVITYIETNYQNSDLSVASIAEALDINASYLSRLFKEHFNENLLAYINIYRIQKAKELLTQTEWTLNKISEKVGYLNSTAIIRSFKRHEGMTPIQYRTLYKQAAKSVDE